MNMRIKITKQEIMRMGELLGLRRKTIRYMIKDLLKSGVLIQSKSTPSSYRVGVSPSLPLLVPFRVRRRGEGISPSETKTSRARAYARETANKEFNEFWAAYPRKVGKRACFALWCRIKKDLPPIKKLLKIIAAQSTFYGWDEKSKDKKERKFIPHPRTWLNQGRWEDDLDSDEPERKPRFDVSCQRSR